MSAIETLKANLQAWAKQPMQLGGTGTENALMSLADVFGQSVVSYVYGAVVDGQPAADGAPGQLFIAEDGSGCWAWASGAWAKIVGGTATQSGVPQEVLDLVEEAQKAADEALDAAANVIDPSLLTPVQKSILLNEFKTLVGERGYVVMFGEMYRQDASAYSEAVTAAEALMGSLGLTLGINEDAWLKDSTSNNVTATDVRAALTRIKEERRKLLENVALEHRYLVSAVNGVQTLTDVLSAMGNDNQLTPAEKQVVVRAFMEYVTAQPENDAKADELLISRTAYDAAIDDLKVYMASLGLTISDRTNFLLYSEDFYQWTRTAAVTLSASDVVPPGTTQLRATKVVVNDTEQTLKQTVAVTPATVYTLSFYVNSATDVAAVGFDPKYAIYDETNGQYLQVPTPYSLQDNTWVRQASSVYVPENCTSVSVHLLVTTNCDLHLYGAQFETTGLTPYIKTVDATVTFTDAETSAPQWVTFTTQIDGAEFRTKFENAETASLALLHAINDKIKLIADEARNAANDAAQAAADAEQAANDAAAEANRLFEEVNGRIDTEFQAFNGKNTTFYQAEPPTATAVGDLWFDTNDGNKIYRWDGNAWVSVRDEGITAAANAGLKTYYQPAAPDTNLVTGDLWFDTDDGNKVYRWSGSAWVSVRDEGIAAAANAGLKTYFQATAPATDLVTGDLWFDSDDSYKMYRWSGTTWVSVRDAGIATAAEAASTAQTTADGKNKTYYQNEAPTGTLVSGDLWFDTNDDYKPYRYDGASWLSVRDGTIASAQSDATTALTAANGKNKTYYQTVAPSSNLVIGDLWFDTDDSYKAYRWSGTLWQSVRDSGISTALNSIGTLQTSVDGKNKTFYQTAEPTATSIGDLWFDTDDNYKPYRWNGTAWDLVHDSTPVVSAEIAAGAVIADKIAAGAVTAGKIAANSITAAEIAADAITASELAAGAVTAGKIAANAITANEIGAGAITTDKLFITGGIGAALNADPMCSDLSAWLVNDPATGNYYSSPITGVVTDGKSGSTVFKNPLGSWAVFYSKKIPLDPTKTYRARCWVRDVGPVKGAFTFRLEQWNGANQRVSLGSLGYDGAALPVEIGYWREATATATLAEDAIYGYLCVILNNDSSAVAQHQIQDIRLEEVLPGTLIKDGAITTSKVSAGAITANELAANSVVADKIAVGAVTAGKISADAITAITIAAGAVTAGKLDVGAVVADNIAAGAVTAGKIAAGAVTAAEISADAITSAKIAAGAVTAGKIAADSITATEIAANAITASELAAGAVTAGKIAAGAVETDKLAAGAVVADKIAAKAVTAKNLTITNFDNIYPNGTCETQPPAELPTAEKATPEWWGLYDAGAGNGYNGSRWVRRLVTNGTSQWSGSPVLYIPAVEGEKYYVECYAKVGVGTGFAHLITRRYNEGPSGGTNIGTGIKSTNSGTWTKLYATVELPAGTVAAGARFIGVSFEYNAESVQPAGQSEYWFDSIYVRRMSDGNLIVDGSITTEKLVAKSITARELALVDFNNIWPNPTGNPTGKPLSATFADTDPVFRWAQVVADSPTGYAHHVVNGTASETYVSLDVDAKVGDEFWFEANINRRSGAGACLYVEPLNQSGINTWGTGWISGNAPLNTWEVQSVNVKDLPSNCVKLRFYFVTQPGTADYTQIMLRRKSNANLIVDGSITTSKLNFTPTDSSNIVGRINASSEGLKISGDKITITGATTFESSTLGDTLAGKASTGYVDTAASTARTDAVGDINAQYGGSRTTTTINGANIQTGTVIADKIAAGAITADHLQVGDGRNLMPYGDFSSRETGWVFSKPATGTWALGFNNGTDWTLGGNPDTSNGYGLTTAYITQGGRLGTGAYAEIVSGWIPAQAGRSYMASVYTGSHRATVKLFMTFLNSAGAGISVASRGDNMNQQEKSGGKYLDGYKRLYTFDPAPTGTCFIQLTLRKDDTASPYTDSFGFFCRAQLEEVGPNVVVPGPWAPGSKTIVDPNAITSDVLKTSDYVPIIIDGKECASTGAKLHRVATGSDTPAILASKNGIRIGNYTFTERDNRSLQGIGSSDTVAWTMPDTTPVYNTWWRGRDRGVVNNACIASFIQWKAHVVDDVASATNWTHVILEMCIANDWGGYNNDTLSSIRVFFRDSSGAFLRYLHMPIGFLNGNTGAQFFTIQTSIEGGYVNAQGYFSGYISTYFVNHYGISGEVRWAPSTTGSMVQGSWGGTPDPPTGGDDGTIGCPSPYTLIKLASGVQIPAKALRDGMKLDRGVHEYTFAEIEGGVVRDPRTLWKDCVRVHVDGMKPTEWSKEHRFGVVGQGWKQAWSLKPGDVIMPGYTVRKIERIGEAPVIGFSVEGAHTYYGAGLLSHNLKKIT